MTEVEKSRNGQQEYCRSFQALVSKANVYLVTGYFCDNDFPYPLNPLKLSLIPW